MFAPCLFFINFCSVFLKFLACIFAHARVVQATSGGDELLDAANVEELEEAINTEERLIEEKQKARDESDTEADSDAPPLGSGPRGHGEPLRVGSFERTRNLCDGAGLCSLGIWPPSMRPLSKSRRIRKLEQLITHAVTGLPGKFGWSATDLFWRLARGECEDAPWPEHYIQDLRERALQIFDDGHGGARARDGDQSMAVHGRLLQAILGAAGDPDAAGMRHYFEGVRLGVGRRLPRTPAVFARKRHWRLPEQHTADELHGHPVEAVWRENYTSAVVQKELISEQLLDHHRRGLALRYDNEEQARAAFGDLTVVSLGAVAKVPEPKSAADIRTLMDGTHGVNINTRIRQRDQDRCPTAADVKRLQRAQAEGRRPIGLALDVAEAHRIPPVHPDDWKYQGCRAETGGPVFVYRYGVFGYSSSAYWWARLGGALVRAAHLVAPPSHALWMLLMADDLKAESTASDREASIVWLVVFLCILGVPLAWRKTKGGDVIDWIGYNVRLQDLSLGVSESRAAWAVGWLTRGARDKAMKVEEFTAGLGRLVFVTGALEYERPFLSPLFAWLSRQNRRGLKKLPCYVCLVMHHLAGRIAERRHYPSAERRVRDGVPFRVDAHASGEEIGIGGWLPVLGAEGRPLTGASRWFSVVLSRALTPWAFSKGLPYRSIAALEALAALVAILAFAPLKDNMSDAIVRVSGLTDNRGNKYATTRLQTGKFPLCVVVMELSAQLEARGQRLEMRWAPREMNAEADRLANGDTRGFADNLRVNLDFSTIPWIVLPQLMKTGESFAREIHENPGRAQRTARGPKYSIREAQPW